METKETISMTRDSLNNFNVNYASDSQNFQYQVLSRLKYGAVRSSIRMLGIKRYEFDFKLADYDQNGWVPRCHPSSHPRREYELPKCESY